MINFLVETASSEDRNGGASQAYDRASRGALNGHAAGHAASARAVSVADLEPFIVEVPRRDDDVAIVRPRGELDLATVETLGAALDGIEGAERLVIDLRGLSFIDCSGLRLLVALHERALRDGFQLTLLAPGAPADRTIQLCGLDTTLPFAAPADAVACEPGESASGAQGGS